jgi:hypothetical protein
MELRKCRQCSAGFPITDKDIEFYKKVSPVFHNKNYLIPPPTLCPDCRQQRRLVFRNERRLYKRKCDATGKDIVSIYSPDKLYIVYHQEYWWSDAWDPLEYGREFDFSRGAFEQFGELLREVPRFSLANLFTTLENAEYTNHFAASKNCFMCFNGSNNQDCFYCDWFGDNMNCIDCSILMRSSYCYESIWIEECSHSSHIESSKWCTDSYYLYNCIGCTDCFLCSNLLNKKYHIRNIEYTKETYQKMLWEIYKNLTHEMLLKEYIELKFHSIQKSSTQYHSENILWDRMSYSHNSYGFDGQNIQNSKYVYSIWDTEKSIDCYELAAWCKYCLESISADTIIQCNFSLNGANNSSLTYSDICFNSSHLFLCTWLRNKQYCILNRQYTKVEYEMLVPKIIEKMISDGDWWEFFPASMSPFGYNETVAQEYYPLSRDEVLGNLLEKGGTEVRGGGLVLWEKNTHKPQSSVTSWQLLSQGVPNEISGTFLHWPLFNWSDYEAPFPTVEKIIPASKLPDTIEGIPDDILNWAIECEVSGKPFRIIKQELEFYRKHSIPIPRRHPDVRHMDRMKMRNPRKLFERICDCCGKKMITTYSPERPETVYCEVCYEGEVLT